MAKGPSRVVLYTETRGGEEIGVSSLMEDSMDENGGSTQKQQFSESPSPVVEGFFPPSRIQTTSTGSTLGSPHSVGVGSPSSFYGANLNPIQRLEAKMERQQRHQEAFAAPPFLEFCEYVLEETLFNLLSEVVTGEFPITDEQNA